MRQWLFWSFMFLLIGGLGYAAVVLTGDQVDPPLRAQVRVTDILREGPAAGFAVAAEPHAFQFPQDHGPHPAFRSEWWYFTGNLATADGRRFGYQLTFFRSALKPALLNLLPSSGDSAWHANHLYMAQFALTDAQGRRFVASDRFERAAIDLAGAQADPFRVWLNDWSAVAIAGPDRPAAEPTPAIRLTASQPADGGPAAIALNLLPRKAPVLQGDHGLSQKSDGPGQASYYYSLTRLETSGTLQVGGETFQVTGLSWMDREWSTSSLGKNQVGWDWFAIHLNDGRDLMYYQLRTAGAGAALVDPHSAGSLTAADGTVVHFTAADVQLQVERTWHSPRTGVVYPARWRLKIPSQRIDLRIQPLIPDQELNLYIQYWEGACQVLDPAAVEDARTPPLGAGYVELTGYARPD